MSFDIGTFLSQGLVHGGARPSKFDIQCNIPAALTGLVDPTSAAKLTFTCKSASIPASQLGLVEAPYFGRKIKLAGDRVFDEWVIQVMLDEDYNSRAVFEVWSNFINSIESNVMTTAAENPATGALTKFQEIGYKSDWGITHYGQDGTTIRQYAMSGAWPRIVGPIAVDWDATNRIIIFPVNVCFDLCVPTLEGVYGNQSLYIGSL